MTLADMCRLCAESVGHCISVFGEDGNKYNLEHKIRVCSPITVSVTYEHLALVVFVYILNS